MKKNRLFFHFALLLCLLSFIASCIHFQRIPREEFKVYVDAFEEVRRTTELLFEDYVAAKKLQAKLKGSATKATRLPPAFDPSTIQTITKEDKAIKDRRAALEAVAIYNGMLLSLAEGKSVDQVKTGLGKLENLFDIVAGSTLPCSGAIKQIIKTVITAAEKARSNAEFVSAFKEATGGNEPVIQTLLDFFIGDTRQYSEMKRIIIVDKRKDINSIFGAQGRTLFSIIEIYTPPSPGTPFYSKRVQLELEYNQMYSQINPGVDYIDFPTEGQKPYNEQAHQQLENIMKPMLYLAKEEQKLVKQYAAYNEGFHAYVKLIQNTKSYLAQIENALLEPQGSSKQFETVLNALGIDLKRDSQVLQSAFKEILLSF